jgi:hypothetical protein
MLNLVVRKVTTRFLKGLCYFWRIKRPHGQSREATDYYYYYYYYYYYEEEEEVEEEEEEEDTGWFSQKTIHFAGKFVRQSQFYMQDRVTLQHEPAGT